jgi:uncharacterized protein YjiS (DUF1127 family)
LDLSIGGAHILIIQLINKRRFRVATPQGEWSSCAMEDRVMRDYALNRAIFDDRIGNRSLFSRLFHNWKSRREVNQLAEFDDFMLADIGVSRADVDWAAHLPLSTDATEELERRTASRQRQAALRRPGWGAY